MQYQSANHRRTFTLDAPSTRFNERKRFIRWPYSIRFRFFFFLYIVHLVMPCVMVSFPKASFANLHKLQE